jgi:hypothetical protein
MSKLAGAPANAAAALGVHGRSWTQNLGIDAFDALTANHCIRRKILHFSLGAVGNLVAANILTKYQFKFAFGESPTRLVVAGSTEAGNALQQFRRRHLRNGIGGLSNRKRIVPSGLGGMWLGTSSTPSDSVQSAGPAAYPSWPSQDAPVRSCR